MWFVSDMHFGHTNIIKHCSRPWDTVEEMDEALVVNWNKAVEPKDPVYHIGDWAFHNYYHIGRLNGNIISVPGNHDHERRAKLLPYLPNGFTEEVVYLKLSKTQRYVLCHYPFASWRREYKFHLHGHTHGMPMTHKENRRLDVGIDATKLYRPMHHEEVLVALTTST